MNDDCLPLVEKEISLLEDIKKLLESLVLSISGSLPAPDESDS